MCSKSSIILHNVLAEVDQGHIRKTVRANKENEAVFSFFSATKAMPTVCCLAPVHMGSPMLPNLAGKLSGRCHTFTAAVLLEKIRLL